MKRHLQKTALALFGTMIISSPFVLANETGTKQEVGVITAKTSSATRITEGKFTDFFPDENFAKLVAGQLKKDISDNVTESELSSITSFPSSWARNIEDITGISYLNNVRGFDFRNHKISEIPEEIGNLNKLVGLHLSGNPINKLPESISNLSSLENLGLYNNNLSSIPEGILKLEKLRDLNLSQNNISDVPKEMGNLTNLVKLDLSENNISNLPNEVGNLSKLEDLRLNNNRLSDMPEKLKNLSNLTRIDISKNKLTSFPEGLITGDMKNLNYIYLEDNEINKIPNNIGESNFENLYTINLNKNNISYIQEDIKNIKGMIYLSENNITGISDSIINNIIGSLYSNISVPYEGAGVIIGKGWNSDLGQTATLGEREIELNTEISKEDIIPKLILQLKQGLPGEVQGTFKISNNGEEKTIKLEDILYDKVDINNIFTKVGQYEVVVETERCNVWFEGIDNTEGHKYTYQVNINEKEVEYKYNIPVNLETTTKNYKVNITGTLEGQFANGSNALSKEVREGQNLKVTVTNTKTGEVVEGGKELIEAIRVNVYDGNIIGYRIYGPAKTESGKIEHYTASIGLVDSAPKAKYSVLVDSEAKTSNYKVNIKGYLEGDFIDGSKVISDSLRNSQNLEVTIENTITGDIVTGGTELIQSMRVNIVDGKVAGYRIYGPAKTGNEKLEYYTLNVGQI